MKLYCRAPAIPDGTYEHAVPTCGGYLGQTPVDLVLVAVVKKRTPRISTLEPHKDVRYCKKCDWWNVYIHADALAKRG